MMKDGRMKLWHGMALVALAGMGVAGCSRSEPEPPEMNMTVQELEPTPEPSPTEAPAPLPEPSVAPVENDSAILPPPEDPAPDAQMMDDASATGMTARTDRGYGSDDTAADTAPATTDARRRD